MLMVLTNSIVMQIKMKISVVHLHTLLTYIEIHGNQSPWSHSTSLLLTLACSLVELTATRRQEEATALHLHHYIMDVYQASTAFNPNVQKANSYFNTHTVSKWLIRVATFLPTWNSLCFPCVFPVLQKFSLCFFYLRTNSNSNKRNVTCSKLYYLFFIKTIHSLTKKPWIINRFFYHVFICIININSLFLFNMKALSTVYLLLH